MIDQNKLKELKSNIRAVVESVLETQKITCYKGTDTLSGTNQDTIEKIKQEIRQFKEFKQDHPELRVTISPLFRSKQIFKIVMVGRLGSFFQDKKINAYIFYPDNYPKMPPVVYFQNVDVNGKQQTYQHVNVFSGGQLCQQIVKNKYNQTIHTRDFLVTIQDTLYNPNPRSPANGNMGTLFQKDRTKHDDVIRRQAFHLQWSQVEQ